MSVRLFVQDSTGRPLDYEDGDTLLLVIQYEMGSNEVESLDLAAAGWTVHEVTADAEWGVHVYVASRVLAGDVIAFNVPITPDGSWPSPAYPSGGYAFAVLRGVNNDDLIADSAVDINASFDAGAPLPELVAPAGSLGLLLVVVGPQSLIDGAPVPPMEFRDEASWANPPYGSLVGALLTEEGLPSGAYSRDFGEAVGLVVRVLLVVKPAL